MKHSSQGLNLYQEGLLLAKEEDQEKCKNKLLYFIIKDIFVLAPFLRICTGTVFTFWHRFYEKLSQYMRTNFEKLKEKK